MDKEIGALREALAAHASALAATVDGMTGPSLAYRRRLADLAAAREGVDAALADVRRACQGQPTDFLREIAVVGLAHLASLPEG